MNTTADPNNKATTQINSQSTNIPVSASVGVGKEQEALQVVGGEAVKEVSGEMEIPEELEKAGVMVKRETIELPPDVKKLGVTPSGAAIPVAQTLTLPKVVLPISDQQVVAGLHAQIMSSLRWLAVWCLKKLQKAHIILKIIHGKIVRVKN